MGDVKFPWYMHVWVMTKVFAMVICYGAEETERRLNDRIVRSNISLAKLSYDHNQLDKAIEEQKWVGKISEERFKELQEIAKRRGVS